MSKTAADWRFFHETTRHPDRPLRGRWCSLVAACGGGGAQSVSDDSVAVVGDQQITKARLGRADRRRPRRNFNATKRAFPKPGTVDLANLKTNATQFLIQSSEYEQEADKLGVKVSDKDDRRAAATRSRSSTTATPPARRRRRPGRWSKRYQAALKQQGFTDEEVRAGDQAPADPREGLREGHGDVKVTRRGDQDLLRQEQAAVRDAGAAGEPRRPPHPRQVEGEGRRALRAAAGRTRASSPRSPRSTRPTPRRLRTAASSRRAPRSRAGSCPSSRRSPSRSRRTRSRSRCTRSSAGTSSRRSGRSRPARPRSRRRSRR